MKNRVPSTNKLNLKDLLTCEALVGLPLTDLMSSSWSEERDQDSSLRGPSASLLARDAAPAQDAREPGLVGQEHAQT